MMDHNGISVTIDSNIPGIGGCSGRNEPDAAAGKCQERTGDADEQDGRDEDFE
jgi:hypothetical protein